MALLHLDALPPRTTKGTLIRLLTQVGELRRERIGTVEVRNRAATIEVPDAWIGRLVKALDGTQLANRSIRAWHEHGTADRGGDDHFLRLQRLLDLEGIAEGEQSQRRMKQLTAREAELAGTSLIDLAVLDETIGLGGRWLMTLGKLDQPLPWTRLAAGSPVLVSGQKADATALRGVVSRRSDRSIEVALGLSASSDRPDGPLRLDLSSDEVARQRQRAALHRVAAAQGERLAVLREVLVGNQVPGRRELPELASWSQEINASQQEAIRWALAAEDVAIIHGPPGTGKTTTLVELIRQAVLGGERLLACAPSNLAVDNLLERLLASGLSAIRVGHPARVLPELRNRTLDLMVESQVDMQVARKLRRDADTLLNRAARYTRAKPLPGSRRQQREEAAQMIQDAKRLEAQVVQQVLDSADIVCGTLTGLDSELLGQRSFDTLVIDEACQSTEPASWIPILRSHRVILAGDHCQLPPTVLSQEAAREGFGLSILERLMAMPGVDLSRQLTTQYRMHACLMDFSSREFYAGSLVADATVRAHCLADLDGVPESALTTTPLQFVDTAGAGFAEEVEADGDSRFNRQEADWVDACIGRLLQAGVEGRRIAVISPYSAQVRLLREIVAEPDVEIDTVDGFQGREKDVVLITLVRSNDQGEIGFLADVRRMNVALTRARRKLIVIGDSATIANHAFYERFLEYVESRAAYTTIWEELSPD